MGYRFRQTYGKNLTICPAVVNRFSVFGASKQINKPLNMTITMQQPAQTCLTEGINSKGENVTLAAVASVGMRSYRSMNDIQSRHIISHLRIFHFPYADVRSIMD